MVLCSELALLARDYRAGKSHMHMTVFIHGSLFTQLWPLDVKSILSGILPGSSPYVEIVKRARKNPLLWQDQALLQEGWCQVTQQTVHSFCQDSLASDDQEKAAYLIVPSYHMLETVCNQKSDYAYFLFGHLGLLSHQYRNQVAQEELYVHLCDTISQYARTYWDITVTIVAHSHGGNIALNLVEAEHKYRRGLRIDNLVMWGTPIQLETMGYVYDHLFKRVINCYSDGDWVQGIDTVSTKQRACFKKLYDERLDFCRPTKTRGVVCDVRWLVGENSQRVGHGNMWLLGREEKVVHTLDPLPVMVLTPALLELLDQHKKGGNFDCNITESGDRLQLTLLYHHTTQVIGLSENIYPVAKAAQELTCKHWKSVDKSRMVLLNYQTGASLWQAFQEWRADGYETEQHIS
jgi:hypothetical protein